MSRPIGPREAAMRAQREENAKEQEAVARKPTVGDYFVEKHKWKFALAAKLPETHGVRPVKRAAKRRSKK